MRKIIHICLGLVVMVSLIGCGASTKDLGETINEKNCYVLKWEDFNTDFQRNITISEGVEQRSVVGYYDKDNTFLGFKFYSDGSTNSPGYASSELTANIIIDSDENQKPLFENWLKDMETSEDDLKEYFVKIGNEKKSVSEIKEIVSDKNFEVTFRDDPLLKGYDEDMYISSSKDKLYMDAYFKDGKLSAFVFADGDIGEDLLFVWSYQNHKILKDDGKLAYIWFLGELNITHEEFMDFIQDTYESQKGVS